MGAMTLVALIPFALRGRGRLDSATFVIVASALAYGASNIATKLVSDGISSGAWLVVAIWLAVTAAIGAGRADHRNDRPATPPGDLRRPGLLRDPDLPPDRLRADLPDRAVGHRGASTACR